MKRPAAWRRPVFNMGIKHREQCRPAQSEEERFEHYVLEIEVYGEIQSFFAIFKAV